MSGKNDKNNKIFFGIGILFLFLMGVLILFLMSNLSSPYERRDKNTSISPTASISATLAPDRINE